MPKIRAKQPCTKMSGKPFKDADYAFRTNKKTGTISTQKINPWTHSFNEKQIRAQEKMRATNQRVHEILNDPELRKTYEERLERLMPPDGRMRLRDYVFREICRRD